MSDFGCGAVNQDKGVRDGTILCPSCRSAKREGDLKADLKAARELLAGCEKKLIRAANALENSWNDDIDKEGRALANEIRAFLGEGKKL